MGGADPLNLTQFAEVFMECWKSGGIAPPRSRKSAGHAIQVEFRRGLGEEDYDLGELSSPRSQNPNNRDLKQGSAPVSRFSGRSYGLWAGFHASEQANSLKRGTGNWQRGKCAISSPRQIRRAYESRLQPAELLTQTRRRAGAILAAFLRSPFCSPLAFLLEPEP